MLINGKLRPAISCLVVPLIVCLSACEQPSSAGSVNAPAALVATVSPAEQLAEFQAAIRKKYDMKEQAFRDNDPEPILTRFYSESVVSTDPDGNTLVGREALAPVYAEVIGSLVKIESYKSFVNGDAGWDWVNFHVTFPAGVAMEPFTFKMLFLWERIDGEWWSHGEMYVLGEFDIAD